MNYPLISEYVEAIKLAEDNLDKLSYLHPVLDDEDRPVMSSGNFAVVFKMKDERDGKFYALKCFIKDQEGRNEAYKLIADELEFVSSEFICPVKFYERELFVNTSNRDETEFPVLLMDWVEGVTLDKYVRIHLNDQYALQLISYQFCRVASWLMAQPFAHGDLKPDNILVKDDGSLVLVDYDGMFVPVMKGQKAREIGSPDYRHPTRTINDFNEHIDDFSLATLAMQLYAVALQPGLLTTSSGDTLLLCEKDYRDLGKSEMMSKLFSQVGNPEFEKLLAIFLLAHSEKTLSKLSFRIFNINKPEKPIASIHLSTEVTDEDIANGVEDEYSVKYSPDGKRLLKGADTATYCIKPGTKVICDKAFQYCNSLNSITIPDSVTHIGNEAFLYCDSLNSITIPNAVTHIGDEAFSCCSSLASLHVNSDNKIYDSRNNCNAIIHTATNTLIAACKNTVIPDSVTCIGKYAFCDCSCLTCITIPDSVTHIGNGAFCGCRGLTTVDIPDLVTHIGDEAFYYCTGLTSIIIPSSVTHIGDKAFSHCESLTSVSIPDSVSFIGCEAFCKCSILACIRVSSKNKTYDSRKNCNAIIHTATNTLIAGCKNTIIPDTITHIGRYAFCYCSALSSINIPNSVKHVGELAFFYCTGLTNISIPDSVTNIGKMAFSHCESLTSVSIPDSVTNIGNSAFSYCHSLASINIPDSVIHIGDQAFSRCESLTSVSIPDSVTHIGKYAFDWCKVLTSIQVSVNNRIYDSRDNCNAIIHTATNTLIQGSKKTVIPYSVTHIGERAFLSCDSLTSIIIPDSVTHIGDYAFSSCDSLTSINIPDSITHIGDCAFFDCHVLRNISISKSVTHIGDHAFASCDNLTKIFIPLGTKEKFTKLINDEKISKLLVEDNESQYTIVTDEDIANGVKDEFGAIYSSDGKRLLKGVDIASYRIKPGTLVICDRSFSFCRNITNITLPSSVTHIGMAAFAWCGVLARITIPNSVTYIGINAFYVCENLTSISLPNSVTHIGDSAFWHCLHLANIKLPNSVTHIGNAAFSSCRSLTSIAIPDSVKHIRRGVFAGCKGLTSITIPNSVTHIEDSAFSGCEGLTSIAIPDSVKHIGGGAFFGCDGLTSITIPNSVTHIGSCAFECCHGLTSITLPNSVTSIGRGAFSDDIRISEIRIPSGSYEKFKLLLPDWRGRFVEE